MTVFLLNTLIALLRLMTALLDRIVGVIAGFQAREADLSQRLADALADDAADEADIQAARNQARAASDRAAAAEALVAQLQVTANDTTSQLAASGDFIAQFEPAPAPNNSTDEGGTGDDQPGPAEPEASAPEEWDKSS